MDKESLLRRKTQAQKQQEAIIVQAQMLGGVIQDCDYWLGEIAKTEATKAAEAALEDAPKEKAPRKTKGAE